MKLTSENHKKNTVKISWIFDFQLVDVQVVFD